MRLSFLDRFRPMGAPGAAGVAVPAKDRRGPEQELAPVFAALAPDVRAGRVAVAEAEQSAAAAVAQAKAEAEAILAQAHIDAAAARARAAAEVVEAAASADQRIMDEARVEADRIATAAAEATPRAVRLVIDRLLEELLGDGSARAGRS